MECNYSEIEKKFSEYILRLIGPTEEQNQIRENKFQKIKNIFERAFNELGITAHIFSFGSFPIRTYLPESDMDITVIIEDSSTKQIIPISSLDYQNKILNVIQFALETHNNEVGFQQITEISHIPAEVKLIKCKFDNLAFDISINNFVGLCKLSFIHQLETKSFDSNLFKRSLFLIKCWGYYEASILGSNVGLMASYALEVLIIFMFNNYSHLFTNEVEAFFTFFQIMNNVDWNKKIITIFGDINIDVYYEKLKSSQSNLNALIEEILQSSKSDINLEDIISLNKKFEKFSDKSQILNKRVIDIKLLNIIDPLFHTNNLGKSINYHNFSKLKKVFEFAANESADIIKHKKEKTISPIDYLNSLLKFFNKIITINNTDLFYMSLPQPKIIIFPRDNFLSDEDEVELNGIKKESDFKVYSKSHPLPNNLNSELIDSFNKFFTIGDFLDNGSIYFKQESNMISSTGVNDTAFTNFVWPSNVEIKSESEINKLQNSYFSNRENYLTKDILDFMINFENEKKQTGNSLRTSEEVLITEEYLKNATFINN